MVVQVSKQTLIAALRVRLKQQQQQKDLIRYNNSPVLWTTEKARGFVWSLPRQIMNSVMMYRRTAVPSCHSSGKSWLSAQLAAFWIDSHPPGTAFVITTAPSAKQVRAVLWKEIRRTWVAANLGGRLNQTEWWLNNELVAMGRKPSDYDPTALQGIHAKYCLVVIDEGCHDDKTEVLTEDGWKLWKEVTLEDRFLSMNPQTHVAEYVGALQIVKKRYKGLMNEYVSRNANFCVTPDHRMYNARWSYPRISKWIFDEFKNIETNQNVFFRHDITWTDEDDLFFQLPEYCGVNKYYPSIDIHKSLWMMFLGWYCSEGSLIYKDTKNQAYVVNISQKNQENLDEIEEICREMDVNYSRYDKDIRVFDVQLANYLMQWGRYCTEKRVPIEVRMASVENINLFLDAYVRGDGYSNKGIDTIYTSSPRMAADLQELVLKTGVNCTVRNRGGVGNKKDFGTHIAITAFDGYVVARSNVTTNLKYRPFNLRKVEYDGMVYCATLEKYGLLMTRRDGYALWSGNCGVGENIYQAANSLAANEFSRLLVIGNPDDPDSHFAKICQPSSGWNVIHVSAFDTPNFTGEECPQEVKDVLVSSIYVEEMKRDVGEESPVYISKVLGQFPENKADGIIPLSWIRMCQDEDEYDKRNWNDSYPVEAGIDVGAGGDETSVRIRYGKFVGPFVEAKTPSALEAFDLIVPFLMQEKPTRIKIDTIGIGWGLLGLLQQAVIRSHIARFSIGKTGYNDERTGAWIDLSFLFHQTDMSLTVSAVNVGVHATQPELFLRLRSQMWWQIGRLLSQDKGWNLWGLDEQTIGELTRPTYEVDTANRIVVESKQKTMQRTDRPSPNRADALLLAYCEPPAEDTEAIYMMDERETIGPDI